MVCLYTVYSPANIKAYWSPGDPFGLSERAPHAHAKKCFPQKMKPAKKRTKSHKNRPRNEGHLGRLAPFRLRCARARPDDTWKKNPCARTPTQPLQHRHTTVAGRATCSTGRASKGDCTLSKPRILLFNSFKHIIQEVGRELLLQLVPPPPDQNKTLSGMFIFDT